MRPVDQAEQLIRRGGHVHLMGIGGIGMAGLAWLLKERGLKVSGCDLQFNRQTQWLARMGIPVVLEHDGSHVANDVDWLIRSTAVPDSDEEIRNVIQQIINTNIEEQQFDECDGITFKALNIIANGFLKKLSSIYHMRISYPGFDFKDNHQDDKNSPKQ